MGDSNHGSVVIVDYSCLTGAAQQGKVIEVERVGIVGVLPVRYALGDLATGVPPISGVFSVSDISLPDREAQTLTPPKGTCYTLRCLRRGYLYVFTESKKADAKSGKKISGWALFEITADNALKPLPLLQEHTQGSDFADRMLNVRNSAGTPSRGSLDSAPLLDAPVVSTPMGILLVPDNVNIWLCFSDATWTPRTLRKAMREPEFRARHMRFFDPAGWATNWKGHAHTSLLGEKADRATAHVQKPIPPLAEFSAKENPDAFWFSKDSFRWHEKTWAYKQEGTGKVYQTVKAALEDLPTRDIRKVQYDLPKWSKPGTGPEQLSLTEKEVLSALGLKQVRVMREAPVTLKKVKTLPPSSHTNKGFEAKEIKNWAIFALEDPVGVARDLSGLTNAKYQAWLRLPDPFPIEKKWGTPYEGRCTGWYLHTSDAIGIIRHAAHSDFLRKDAIEQEILKPNPQIPTDNAPYQKKWYAENYSDQSKVSRMNKSWEENYANKYDWAREQAWYADFKPRLEKLDAEVLLPIVRLFVNWMESGRLKAYFDGVFDDADTESGAAFRTVLDRCYTGLEEKVPVMEHLGKWINLPLDKRNLLGRAFVFNHKSLREAIQKETKAATDNDAFLSADTWKQLIKKYHDAINSYLKGDPNVLMMVTQYILGPSASVLLKSTNGRVLPSVLVALCIESNKAYLTYERSGTVNEFIEHLTDELSGTQKNSPEWVSLKAKLKRRRDEMVGAGLTVRKEDPVTKEITVVQRALVDADLLSTITKNTPNRDKRIAALVMTDKQASLRREGNIAVSNLMFGSVLGIFDFTNMVSTIRALDSAMAQEKGRKIFDAAMLIPAFAFSVVEYIGHIWGAAARLGSKAATERRMAVSTKLTGFAGKGAAVVGLVTSVVGAIHAFKEASRERYCLAFAMFVSSGLSFAAGLGVLCGAAWAAGAPFTIIAVLVGFAAGVLIDWLSDSKMQSWLSRCCWGSLSQERYNSWNSERREFELVMRS